jgi:DNA invertase Pin-like site-specific DNA recombinase
MADGKFVAYYRVSTQQQGQSGLGLEGQKAAVEGYLNGGSWTLLASFTEIESGGSDDRPQLARAIQRCRLTGATLIISKIDRLSRDVHFLTGLKKSGVRFLAVDNPNATDLTINILISVAQDERERISERTKAALQAAKARGTKLGGYRGGPAPDAALSAQARRKAADEFAAMVGARLREIQTDATEKLTLQQLADALTIEGVETARGGVWTPTAVRNVLARCGAMVEA